MRARCALVCGLLLLAGCGGGAPAEVTGTVRFDNKPLTAGTVTLVGADGKERFSAIGPGGEYHVYDVPAGPVRFAVRSREKIPSGLLGPGDKQQPVVKIPPRYEKVETSDLTANVHGRVFKHDLTLEP
jgi:hypothetical protein